MGLLDMFYVAALLLGGGYSVISILMGGLAHVAHTAGHIGDVGGHVSGDVGHVGDVGGHAGHVGHGGAGDAGHVGGGHGHVDIGDVHSGDAAHHGGDHADQAHSEDSTGRMNLLAYMNPTLLAGMLLGIGTGGVASRMMGVQPAPSLLFAGGGGLLLWESAYLIVAKMFGGSQGSSHTRRDECVGVLGKVTAPIDGLHPGMVSMVIAGTRQSVRAIAAEGESIPVGSEVRIRRMDGGTALVAPCGRMDWQLPEPQIPPPGDQEEVRIGNEEE